MRDPARTRFDPAGHRRHVGGYGRCSSGSLSAMTAMWSLPSGAATRSRRRSGSVILDTLDGPTLRASACGVAGFQVHYRVASGLARADARSGGTQGPTRRLGCLHWGDGGGLES
jgi:hypothetical protein